jgi:CubicO group peptidase (beta-lactamase class C family)
MRSLALAWGLVSRCADPCLADDGANSPQRRGDFQGDAMVGAIFRLGPRIHASRGGLVTIRPRAKLFVVTAVGLVLAAGAWAFQHLPCWASYRAPALTHASCLETKWVSSSLHNGPQRLGRAEELWARGVRDSQLTVVAAAAAVQAGQTDTALTWLGRSLEVGGFDARWFETTPALAALRTEPRFGEFLAAAHASALAGQVGAGLAVGSLTTSGIDQPALDALLARAKEANSSALVLVKDGAVLGEWYFDGGQVRTELMSATKAITGLAIGFLVADGLVANVDAPLSRFFPTWSDGLNAKVTLRHVLTHTSGLLAKRSVIDFIWRADFVEYAVDSPVTTEPGTVMLYNNKAMNLLTGVVQQVAHRPLDAWLDEKLFTPLGIRDWDWLHDPAGNPHGMSGLRLHPLDLAKIGVMLADGGRWQGREVLPAAWVEQATHPSVDAAHEWGFLFHVHARTSTMQLDAAARASLPPELAEKLAPLEGRRLDTGIWRAEASKLVSMEAFSRLGREGALPKAVSSDDLVGYSAIGSGGIHLTVFPSEHLVAVRMSRSDGMDTSFEFPDFPSRVQALLPSLR